MCVVVGRPARGRRQKCSEMIEPAHLSPPAVAPLPNLVAVDRDTMLRLRVGNNHDEEIGGRQHRFKNFADEIHTILA